MRRNTMSLAVLVLAVLTLSVGSFVGGASALPSMLRGPATSIDGVVSASLLSPAVRLRPPDPSAPSAPTAPGAPAAPPVSPTAELAVLVNAERIARGLAPVVRDPLLELVAQRHSEDQARQQKMSHTGSDGSTLVQRIERVGYVWQSVAENVGTRYESPALVIASWMSSETHRRNILSANTQIGVGLAAGADGLPYWTMVLATPR